MGLGNAFPIKSRLDGPIGRSKRRKKMRQCVAAKLFELRFAAAIAVVGLGCLGAIPAAQACPGVIATIVGHCELDDLHKAIGSPLNRLVQQNPIGAPAQQQPAPIQMVATIAPPMAGPIGIPPGISPMGSMCVTQVGAFPGPMNPIGSPCQAMTIYGPVVGMVR
jgi:hypothetical protein